MGMDQVICEDVGALAELVVVSCTDLSGKDSVLDPTPVGNGGIFTVSGGGGSLPSVIYCTIADQGGNPLQWNLIDTSVNEPVHLKEQYGALQVEGCNDQQCLQELDYTYTIVNGGSHSLNVVDVTRTFNGEQSESLLDGLSSNPLAMGESAVVEETVGLDICQTVTLVTVVDVDAQPDDGPECDGLAEYTVDIAPQCSVGVHLTCEETDSSVPCQDLQSLGTPPCVCGDNCATSLSFVYTGNNCRASSSSPFLLECMDGSGPKPSTVFVNANSPDGSSLFAGTVQEGDMVTVTNGGACLPDTATFIVSDPNASPVVIYQDLTLSPGCSSQGIRMSEDYGALSFTGFECQDGFEENCFTDITLTACTANEGTVVKTITDMELEFEGQTTDLLNGATPSLETGEIFCSSETATVSLCGEPSSFEAEVAVESDDTSGIGCNDMESLEFTPYPRPTASPTVSPTPAPTPSPTPSPTPRPTPRPSPRPTHRPTHRPTPRPTHAPVHVPSKGMFVFASVCLCSVVS